MSFVSFDHIPPCFFIDSMSRRFSSCIYNSSSYDSKDHCVCLFAIAICVVLWFVTFVHQVDHHHYVLNHSTLCIGLASMESTVESILPVNTNEWHSLAWHSNRCHSGWPQFIQYLVWWNLFCQNFWVFFIFGLVGWFFWCTH